MTTVPERPSIRASVVSPSPVEQAAPPSGPAQLAVVPSSPSVTLLPAALNFSIYSGDSLQVQFQFQDANNNPVNMAGTWSAEIRVNPGDPDPSLASFTCDSSQAATGIVNISLTSAQTNSLPIAQSLVWDLEWTTGSGAVQTTHQGTITVTEDVTRP